MKRDSFCIVPWAHARLNQDGSVTPCCRYEGPEVGTLRKNKLTEIWNGEALTSLRAEFLEGGRPAGCSDCYNCEAIGQRSLRQTMNDMHEDEVAKLEAKSGSERLIGSDFRSIDIRFSNNCNFRCRSCGPKNSVSWYRDAKKLSFDRPEGVDEISRTDEEFEELVDVIAPRLRLVYFAGGEPMIDERHYEFLDLLVRRGKTDVALDYNTNFSTLKWKDRDVVELWKKFDKVSIGASLDGVGRQGEILRKGMKWEETVANWKRLSSERPATEFFVYLTVSAMNAHALPETFEEFHAIGMMKKAWDVRLNVVRGPSYILLGILRPKEREELKAKYATFIAKIRGNWDDDLVTYLDGELRAVLRAIPEEILEDDRAYFKSYMFALDCWRKERSGVEFPALQDIVYGA